MMRTYKVSFFATDYKKVDIMLHDCKVHGTFVRGRHKIG